MSTPRRAESVREAPTLPGDVNQVPESALVLVDRFELGRLVARGGMGDIHEVRDVALNRVMALKELRQPATPRNRQRFLREARVQAALQHPGVVPIHDLIESPDGRVYFTMNRVEGETLADVLAAPESSGRSLHQLLAAFQSVCLTAEYAHEAGVVHRDLKPGNVMLGPFGEVYVLDWGIAKLASGVGRERRSSGVVRDELVTHQGSAMGTPEYVAPEQYSDSATADVRSDVFSLGAILFEILCGEPLRAGDDLQVQQSIFRPSDPLARLRAHGVAGELALICTKALAREPEDRYQSARALADAVEAHLSGARDLARRKREAGETVSAAMSRLSMPEVDVERTTAEHAQAIRELAKALALDPERQDALGALRHILESDSAELPAVAAEELARQRSRGAVAAARASVMAYAFWVACVVLAAGISLVTWPQAALLGAPAAVLIALNLWVGFQGRFPRPLAFFALLSGFGAVGTLAATSASHVLVPCMAVTTAVTFLVAFRFDRWLCGATFVVAPMAAVTPELLHWSGVWPGAHPLGHASFDLMRLPAAFEPYWRGAITTAIALLVVTCAALVWRVVAVLEAAERRQAARAWWLRQVLPEVTASLRPAAER